MNKVVFNITVFVTIIVANHIALLWLPWYLILPITAVVAYIFRLRPGIAALMGFLSLFTLWTVLAILTDISNNFILTGKIGELFGGLNSLSLWLLTGTFGGIGGCLGAWLGGLLGYRKVEEMAA